MKSMCTLLEHSSSCIKPCYLANDCKKMKQLICHFFLCINKKNCNICNEINSIIHDHSSQCNLTACPVIMCSTYRYIFISIYSSNIFLSVDATLIGSYLVLKNPVSINHQVIKKMRIYSKN